MKRRDFLGTITTASAFLAMNPSELLKDRLPVSANPGFSESPGSPSVRIAHIDLFPVRYPMTGYFKFFTGSHGSAGWGAD